MLPVEALEAMPYRDIETMTDSEIVGAIAVLTQTISSMEPVLRYSTLPSASPQKVRLQNLTWKRNEFREERLKRQKLR